MYVQHTWHLTDTPNGRLLGEEVPGKKIAGVLLYVTI
jgi:hypothetical protein